MVAAKVTHTDHADFDCLCHPSLLLVGRKGHNRQAVLVGAAAELRPLLQPGRPTTILADLATPQPTVVNELKAAAPDCGLLVLVSSYDLGEIIPLALGAAFLAGALFAAIFIR